MKITLGGLPVLDATREAQNLVRLGLPAPPEFGHANSLVNPLGESPGRGWFCMLRRHVDLLDLDALHQLVLDDGLGTKITVHDLCIVAARRLVPSRDDDERTASYLVEVGDPRWRTHNPYNSVPVENKHYNVRAPGWGANGADETNRYYADSLNGGALWTWSTMVENLWGQSLNTLGSFPGLPFTPHGSPEGWRFVGVPVWPALCQVLDRIGCAVRWDPTKALRADVSPRPDATGALTIVRVGTADATFDALEARARAKGRKLQDEAIVEGRRGRVPRGVLVLFHRQNDPEATEETTNRAASGQWSTNAYYSVTVLDTAADTGPHDSTYHPLWDDLPALFDAAGNITNAAALSARASERATDYYRILRSGGAARTSGGRRHRVYSGLWPLIPGSQCQGVAWRQDARGGLVTEVVRHPWRRLRAGEPGGPAWEEVPREDNTRIHTPDLRPTVPVYPHLLQVVGVLSSTPATFPGSPSFVTASLPFPGKSGLYQAYVERSDGEGVFTDRELIWLMDLAGKPLNAGDYRLARRVGFVSNRPLYATRNDESPAGDFLLRHHTSNQAFDAYGGLGVRFNYLSHPNDGTAWYSEPPGYPGGVLTLPPGVYDLRFYGRVDKAAGARVQITDGYQFVDTVASGDPYRDLHFHHILASNQPISTGISLFHSTTGAVLMALTNGVTSELIAPRLYVQRIA